MESVPRGFFNKPVNSRPYSFLPLSQQFKLLLPKLYILDKCVTLEVNPVKLALYLISIERGGKVDKQSLLTLSSVRLVGQVTLLTSASVWNDRSKSIP